MPPLSVQLLSRRRSAALVLGSLLSVLTSVQSAMAATTLAPFNRFVVTTRIAGAAGSTVYEPRVISDAGEVGGAVVRSAGKVWKWLPPSGDIWDGSFGLFPRLVSTQYVNATPAVWSGGALRELPAFGGNHSTWITGLTADGHWLALVSAEAGRFPTVVGDRAVRVPIRVPRFVSAQGQYSAVIGPGNEDAGSFRADRNDAGVLVYQNPAYEAKDRRTHLVVNGVDRTLLPPGGTSNVRLAGLSDEGGVLLSDWDHAPAAAGGPLVNCHVHRQGVYLPVQVTVSGTMLDSKCNAMARDGTVLGSVTVPNPVSTSVDRTALYVWKDGQTTLMTDFVPDSHRRVPAVDAIGWSDIGIVGRKDVSKYGIYRQGVFIDALASAGVVVKAREYASLISHNRAGQLLILVQNDSAGSKYYVVLSPR